MKNKPDQTTPRGNLLPRPVFFIVAIGAMALFFICAFYGLVAITLTGPEALAVGCLLIALSLAYSLAAYLSVRCINGDPPDWLDGSRATMIAAILGLCAALPITIIGGYASNIAAVALTAFLGGVIPVQIWLARKRNKKSV